MFNLNRITLIGNNTGGDPKVTQNGPTTLSLATNVSWTDKQTNERRATIAVIAQNVSSDGSATICFSTLFSSRNCRNSGNSLHA